MEEFPNKFDLVVLGTGFSESIVAAAASRIGKSVLHLDPNEFYGSTWSSFNLEAFQKLIDDSIVNLQLQSEPSNDIGICKNVGQIKSASHKWYLEEQVNAEISDGQGENEWTKEKVLKEFRKFNIDLTPKILFSAGKLVELLIKSNICRYAEFRSVDKICTIFDGQVKNVPCSRTDVFNSTDLTIVEKRLLMKLLTQCISYDGTLENLKEFDFKTFLEFLESNNLTKKIIHCVLYSICMGNEETSLEEGMERTKKFLNSLGRYGNTPFLFPMYGCGEIPQCFCRLCAVFGGIYCLKKSIDGIKIINETDNEKTIQFCLDNQEIKVNQLVIGSGNIPKGIFVQENDDCLKTTDHKCGKLSRAIFISSTPIGDSVLNSGGGGVNLLRLPGEGNQGAFVIQLSHHSGTCPKELYLINIIAEANSSNPEEDLKPYVDQILKLEHSPKIIYSSYFQITECKNCSSKTNLQLIHSNIYLTCGPFFELDYDLSIENAEIIFKKMYPNEEFLPRAPDPEEIIIGDEDPTAVKEEETLDTLEITEVLNKIQEDFENQVECIEENSQNEFKDQSS